MNIFAPPGFGDIFGFEPGKYNKHWTSPRVASKLKELSDKADRMRDQLFEIFGKGSDLVSWIDFLIWFRKVKVAEADYTNAVGEFSWARHIAQRAGFEI
jgi:hypothetical protein